MTPAREGSRTSRYIWSFPFVSIALGGLLLLPEGQLAYLIGVTVVAVLAACSIAIDDYRTGLLRDRWTGPFAVTGLIQVLIASTGLRNGLGIAATCLIGAAVTTSLYGLFALVGWVGFGDVKFAVGLGLFVAIPAGWTGLYLLPLALAISSFVRLVRCIGRMRVHPHSAHGPALATALGLLMSAACLNYG